MKKDINLKRKNIAIPMSLGLVTGIVLGAAIDKIAIGLIIGIIIGGIGILINKKRSGSTIADD
jgi:uncharacterized membrane protein